MGESARGAAAPAERLEQKEVGAYYEAYSERVYRFCLRRLGDREEALDLCQDTFLNAHRALQRGVAPERPLDWLFSIARNLCRSRHRARFVRRGTVRLDDVGDPLGAREPPDEAVLALLSALARLPERQRVALLLREMYGLSYQEIATELGVSCAAVASLVFRARRTLGAPTGDEPRVEKTRSALLAGGVIASLRALLESHAASTVAVTLALAVGTATLVQPALRPTPLAGGAAETSHRIADQASRPTGPVARPAVNVVPGANGPASSVAPNATETEVATGEPGRHDTGRDGLVEIESSPVSMVAPSSPEHPAAMLPTTSSGSSSQAQPQLGPAEAAQPPPPTGGPEVATSPAPTGPVVDDGADAGASPAGAGSSKPPDASDEDTGSGTASDEAAQPTGPPSQHEQSSPGQAGDPPGHDGVPGGGDGAAPSSGQPPPGQGGTPPGQEGAPPGHIEAVPGPQSAAPGDPTPPGKDDPSEQPDPGASHDPGSHGNGGGSTPASG